MSFQMRVKPHRLAGALFVTEVRDALLAMAMKRKYENKLRQADIAREVGVDRSVVNRQLTGKADLSLMRVGELAEILGCVAEFRLVPKDQKPGNAPDAGYLPPARSGGVAQMTGTTTVVPAGPRGMTATSVQRLAVDAND